MSFLGLTIQYHRMPKWLRGHKTTAPSLVRFFWRRRFLADFHVPKYGRE